jgi:hypothetical protein
MDLSAVRTLKEPGKGGISNNVHGLNACFDLIPLPFPAAQQISDFFPVNELFFTLPLTYET